jgi:CheY-like chemotaxis protein
MKENSVILVAELDDGHFALIKNSLRSTGIHNRIQRFTDGRQLLDLLFTKTKESHQQNGQYLLLMDVRLPDVNGIEVLEKIKKHPQLKKIPVIMLTAADDSKTIERCHDLGCSIYIVKPDKNEGFTDAVKKIGLFLSVVEIPQISTVV